MKTWVVRAVEGRTITDRCWIGNAESAEEAIKYAIAKGNLVADKYIVYDHDLNRHDFSYRLDPTPAA